MCESLIGNVTTDALRLTYNTDFAITNSGGLRADLTCPTTDLPSDFCPAYTPPPYPITRGQVLGVLPFGNVVFTVDISGAELKTFLENGVSLMPSANGRFPQVSGLCFTYDIEAAAGSRVLSAVRQAARRYLHRAGYRSDGCFDLHDCRERLYGNRWGWVSERVCARHHPEHHGPGACRLHRSQLAG